MRQDRPKGARETSTLELFSLGSSSSKPFSDLAEVSDFLCQTSWNVSDNGSRINSQGDVVLKILQYSTGKVWSRIYNGAHSSSFFPLVYTCTHALFLRRCSRTS